MPRTKTFLNVPMGQKFLVNWDVQEVYVRGTTPSILHLYALTGWGPNFRGLCSRTLSRPLWWYFAFYLATSRPMFTGQLQILPTDASVMLVFHQKIMSNFQKLIG